MIASAFLLVVVDRPEKGGLSGVKGLPASHTLNPCRRIPEVLDEAFALLGRDGETGHEAAGRGVLDYDHYLHLLWAGGYDGPLILHGLAEAQVASSVAFLREKPMRSSPRGPS